MHPRNFDSHLTGRPPDRPSAPLAHQYKITQSSGMATQMQLEVLVQGNRMAAGLLEREKNNNKFVSFSTLFSMFTLTWITEKGLERVIENKGEKFRWKKNMKISWRR